MLKHSVECMYVNSWCSDSFAGISVYFHSTELSIIWHCCSVSRQLWVSVLCRCLL